MTALQRILHVDDEPDIREVAVMTLEAIGGFTVLGCASGNEALEKAEEFAPELIILDMMMPGLDGLATMLELRKIPALTSVPIIFMTAKVQVHEVDEYIQKGAAGVVTKPFDPMTLSDQVSAIWNAEKAKAS